jgi:putative ABC transport system permease protein
MRRNYIAKRVPFAWVENLIRDVSYGARNLLRDPAFTAVAVVVLALGIGANTAIFGVVNTVLLRPLEYRDADRLVTVLHNGNGPVAPANYVDWRDQSRSFEGMGAADFWSPNVTALDTADSSPAEHLLGLKVTQNMLPLLGVSPLMGRLFLKGEDQEGADHEVILSYALWHRKEPSPRIRILVVDDHPVLREGLAVNHRKPRGFGAGRGG